MSNTTILDVPLGSIPLALRRATIRLLNGPLHGKVMTRFIPKKGDLILPKGRSFNTYLVYRSTGHRTLCKDREVFKFVEERSALKPKTSPVLPGQNINSGLARRFGWDEDTW